MFSHHIMLLIKFTAKNSLRNGTSEETGLELALWLLRRKGDLAQPSDAALPTDQVFLQGEPVKLTCYAFVLGYFFCRNLRIYYDYLSKGWDSFINI